MFLYLWYFVLVNILFQFIFFYDTVKLMEAPKAVMFMIGVAKEREKIATVNVLRT